MSMLITEIVRLAYYYSLTRLVLYGGLSFAISVRLMPSKRIFRRFISTIRRLFPRPYGECVRDVHQLRRGVNTIYGIIVM